MGYPIFSIIYRGENSDLDDLITADVYKDGDKYITYVNCEKLNCRVSFDFDEVGVAIRYAYSVFGDYYEKTVLNKEQEKGKK